MRILMVPGYTNSGPEHWQTLWERRTPIIQRVLQRDWDRPLRGEWVDELDRTIGATEGRIVLVAHSLGCATVVHWLVTTKPPTSVVGALLVAPADVDQPGWPSAVRGFRPMPMVPLGVETTLVSSQNDPWVSPERARAFSNSWGSRFVDAGTAGHMDSGAGLNDWAAGWRLLNELLERCGLEAVGTGEEGAVQNS